MHGVFVRTASDVTVIRFWKKSYLIDDTQIKWIQLLKICVSNEFYFKTPLLLKQFHHNIWANPANLTYSKQSDPMEQISVIFIQENVFEKAASKKLVILFRP